mmetsp:Transcript_1181/g.2591  ORF Transcript_1181/g.2591 Transcript_1181/m.2591 type:complete len:204 (-) Transcript_1181:316-927(-)
MLELELLFMLPAESSGKCGMLFQARWLFNSWLAAEEESSDEDQSPSPSESQSAVALVCSLSLFADPQSPLSSMAARSISRPALPPATGGQRRLFCPTLLIELLIEEFPPMPPLPNSRSSSCARSEPLLLEFMVSEGWGVSFAKTFPAILCQKDSPMQSSSRERGVVGKGVVGDGLFCFLAEDVRGRRWKRLVQVRWLGARGGW